MKLGIERAKRAISGSNSTNIHGLVYDPIPFTGGSKVATAEMLITAQQQLKEQTELSLTSDKLTFTILTADAESWRSIAAEHQFRIINLPKWTFLTQVQGLRYWVAQLCYTLILLGTLLRIKRVNYAIGASGPGIDMALYATRFLVNLNVIQLIHGPVAASRSIGYCLTKADQVFYLTSAYASVHAAINRYFTASKDKASNQSLATAIMQSNRYNAFANGLTDNSWPTRSQPDSTRIYWAASLLKWKGLDTLVEALELSVHKPSQYAAQLHSPIHADICYIQPKSTQLGISQLPTHLNNVTLHSEPNNLDKIRSQAGIFVSTSINEPFGLSILESLAAGLCVVIPKDGAYWDTVLTDGVHCIKYAPQDSESLANALTQLMQNSTLRYQLSLASIEVAKQYHATQCYAEISHVLTSLHREENNSHVRKSVCHKQKSSTSNNSTTSSPL